MYILKIKKDALTGVGLALLFLLLFNLCGCNSNSDPTEYYQTIGSWEGTIGDKRVKGIIAADGSYHLAVVDTSGTFLPNAGVYTGAVSISDAENNIGSMSLKFLQPSANAVVLSTVSFKLTATTLYSEDAPIINLIRTGDANGPASQDDVAGYWSVLAADNYTNVVVEGNGTFTGGDGGNCRYDGTLSLLDPAWNIYSLNIVLSDIPGKFCLDAEYSGLAMELPSLPPVPPLKERARLWFAASTGERIFLGEWAKTDNGPPVAQMTILGELSDQVLVKEGAAVELDAQGSSDINKDKLTFEWSGTDPAGVALSITGGSIATFVPTKEGLYSLRLVVGDGIFTSTLTRSLLVKWTPQRFVDCMNGTVLDTKTNLLWLQDAGCIDLNQGTIWGVPHAEALTLVGALANDGCGGQLDDNSTAGVWRLPTKDEFSYLFFPIPANPGIPQKQWSEPPFSHVGTNLDPDDPVKSPLPYYWTGTSDPEVANYWFYVDTSVASDSWFGPIHAGTLNAVWPVRPVSEAEITSCQPPPN